MATMQKATNWTPSVMKVYQKYPMAFRSKYWDEIVRLANSGDVKNAEMLAADHQDSHKSHRAGNVIARRLRMQRVKLIQVQKERLKRIETAFEIVSQALSNRIAQMPNSVSAIKDIREKIHASIVDLRRSLNVIVRDLVWRSIQLGVMNMGEALKPIVRDNKESFAEEAADIELLEAKLTFGMDKRFSGQVKPSVRTGSDKWQTKMDQIYRDIVKSNNDGLSLSDRILDLTSRAEQDLKRMLVSDIAQGKSSRDIAKHIEKYIYSSTDDDFQTGPGIYRSPLKNAQRVARTETNRAYTKATAAWAGSKPWIKGIMATLSASHEQDDECDDIAGKVYDPDEFENLIPVHPHCMCFGTYVIDEDYLTGDSGGEE